MSKKDDNRVLITFQVEPSLREAATDKAKSCSINLSEYLRSCVEEFVGSDKIEKAVKDTIKSSASSYV
jgi:hypothetical protein